jgi:hypothetical protein
MDEGYLAPFYVILFYIIRCLVPLGIMLGLSYLLRRLGLISKPPRPPKGRNDESNGNPDNHNPLDGGLVHG